MSILTRNSEARCVCKFVGVVLHAGKEGKPMSKATDRSRSYERAKPS